MERIGLAASKMAKGNLFLYNFYVIFISFLLALFAFVITGATVLFALVIIGYVSEEIMAYELSSKWSSILMVCLVSLSIVIGLFQLAAIIRNIKLSSNKK